MTDRVDILCEDRLTERLLRGLCDRFGVKVREVIPAPEGGDKSAWVLAQYPKLVRKRRSRNFQTGLGLLVHIDGDVHGVQERHRQLDAKLTAHDPPVAPRAADEPVAVIVPTWCTETWLLHLAGIAQPPESARLKRPTAPPWVAAMRTLRADERAHIRSAVQTWPNANLPSVQHARNEVRKIGL